MIPKVTAIDVTTVQERVYRELRSALQQGRLVSGQSMTVRALARAVGTSEMPVREALRRLIVEGALVQVPNRSFQVVPMTLDRLAELTRVRVALEGMAARLAAGASNAAFVARLTALNAQMQDAVRAGESNDEILRANQEFHFAIYTAAASPQLLEFIDMLWLRSGPYLSTVLRGSPEARDLFRRGAVSHDRLIRAMARRDANAAARALIADIEQMASSAMKLLTPPAKKRRRTVAMAA
ncbi:GntR family transcriptional regulator [Acidisoma cladoniae]|uniref:GntR family transcriptional regulator n=1 Tax=Acidisoma cladoniae TaxID=3040935 RepID=UPI00254AF7DE|nr:GntR family transcriptional regulator [Acidisoma sp. PAMC 29798]